MINVNQITSQLARMPDQALQQYAQMHKSDPYVLSLALAESNRRKEMRQGAQMSVPPQPKVVDQEIQGMAAPMPENVGIGQLPAGDMNFADGGIVAFGSGGDVPRFNGASGSVPNFNPTDPEEIRRLAERRLRAEQLRESFSKLPPGAAPSAGGPSFFQYMKDKLSGLRPTGVAGWGLGAYHSDLNANEDAELKKRRGMGATIDPTDAEIQQAMDAGAFKRAGAPGTISAAPDGGTAAPRQRAPAGGPGTAAAPAATVTTPPQGGLADLQKTYEDIYAKQAYKDPATERLSALETKETAAAQAEKAALERDQARFADVFKGREERLGKREAAIGEQKDTNTNLALLNAGLAIMSTPGGFATALGKGAQVGTAHFAAGLDKLRAAQEKLDEARDRMEELKLNRDEMSAKEVRAADSKIRNVSVDAEKRAIDGIRQAAQVNRETAKTIFDKTAQVGITQLEVAGRERVAQIGLQGSMAQAAATRDSAKEYRMAGLAENTRKTITAEAIKKFPYDTAAQDNYVREKMREAVQANPALAQYMGASGGGGAPSGADLRFDQKTGQFVPMR